MKNFPISIQELIYAFQRLPGVGPKTAERFALFIARKPKHVAEQLIRAIEQTHTNIATCTTCYTVSESPQCMICNNARRDQTMLCVVAEPQDVLAIERSGAFDGIYHVLGGVVSPIDGTTPETLRIRELETRLNKHQQINELILALDPTIEGEATVLYLKKRLAPFSKRMTRLARGLPLGADIEYADDVTVADALRGRREV